MWLRRGLVVVMLAGCAISDCLDPTEIELVLSTNVPCASVRNAAIAVGAPGDDDSGISAVSMQCSDDGGLGTLVVIPSGTGDFVGIRATLGVNAGADRCAAPSFTGCVVARRSLSYTPHQRLFLPIELDGVCLGNPCDPNSTCVNGTCVDAGATCPNDTCMVEDAAAPPPDAGDAGTCDIGPTLVSSLPTTAVQPRLAWTKDGIAVGFTSTPDSGTPAYVAVAIDANGNGGSAQTVAALSGSLPVGALGSDGSNYAVAFMNPNSTLYATTIPVGGGSQTSPAVAPGISSVSGFGMIWDAMHPFYWFLATSTNGLLLLGFAPTNLAMSVQSLQTTTTAAQSLSASGGMYFATFVDTAGNCYVDTIASLAPVLFAPATYPSCSMVRAAAIGGATLIATRDQTIKGTAFLQSNTASKASLGAVDAQSLIVLATGSTFQVVWGNSGAILSEPITPSFLVGAPVTLVTAGTAPLLFDAVADPTGTGYSIAYYAATPSPGIYYMHFCQ